MKKLLLTLFSSVLAYGFTFGQGYQLHQTFSIPDWSSNNAIAVDSRGNLNVANNFRVLITLLE